MTRPNTLYAPTVQQAATYFPTKATVFTEKIGSSCYVAPEVLKEEYYPHKADMWSFGKYMMFPGDGWLRAMHHT